MSSNLPATQNNSEELSRQLNNALTKPAVSKWLAQVVPSTFARYLTPERVAKIVMAAASRNPILLQCTQRSIIKSVAELVSIGLEPGGPLQQAYLVPRRNGKLPGRPWEAHAMPSYRGLIALLRRSGEFKSVAAHAVFEHDHFELDLASEHISHKPELRKDRGDLLAVYCVAHFTSGGTHLDFMTISDVEAVRSRSASPDNGPWKTDYVAMALKSVVKRASKYWPMSSEDLSKYQAIESRDRHDDDASGEVSLEIFDAAEVPAVDGEVIDATTGEVLPASAAGALPAKQANGAGRRVLDKLQAQPQAAPVAANSNAQGQLSDDEAWNRARQQAAADEAAGLRK